MHRKSIVVLALLTLSGVGTAIFLSDAGQNDGRVSVSPTANTEAPATSGAPTAQAPAEPERIILADNSVVPILSDVDDLELDHQVVSDFISARPIGAYRIVQVDADYLRSKIRESSENPYLSIQLLGVNPVVLISRSAQESSSGWDTGIGTWMGIAEGDETSSASFVVGPNGSVNGVIRTLKTGRIKIEPIKGTPHHIVWQLAPDFSRKID